jgi:hypothetical protein
MYSKCPQRRCTQTAASALDLTELATWESRYEAGRTISCGYWAEEAIVKLKYVE